jgi:hypothetical protein
MLVVVKPTWLQCEVTTYPTSGQVIMQNTLRNTVPSFLCRLSRSHSRSFHFDSLNFKSKSPWPPFPPKLSLPVPKFYATAGPRLTSTLDVRFFSANSKPLTRLPILSPPAVGHWLLLSSTLVFAIIVVGGVTRLTESGLSITEWQPITGILPPLSQEEWNEEFEKYKATPEFKL